MKSLIVPQEEIPSNYNDITITSRRVTTRIQKRIRKISSQIVRHRDIEIKISWKKILFFIFRNYLSHKHIFVQRIILIMGDLNRYVTQQ